MKGGRAQTPTLVNSHGDPERVPKPPRDGLRRAKLAYAHAIQGVLAAGLAAAGAVVAGVVLPGAAAAALGRLSSRFFLRSSSLTEHRTPSDGTSSLADQRMALRTRVRNSGMPQFVWLCAPVKPKARPPSSRSVAQASVCRSGYFLPSLPTKFSPLQ